MRTHELRFRPRARLVSILGEHLISDQAVGLIELVKNSYDADATEVVVDLIDVQDSSKATVIVSDNGCGMTVDDVRLKWLSPAVDHKEHEKRANRRTPLGRLPIGEKGVGRFAVHQLGSHVEMVTRSRGAPEVVVDVDWAAFDGPDVFLDGVPVRVVEREPSVFVGAATGTRLTVTGSRTPWTEKLVRKVARTLRRLQSPLQEEDQRFRVSLRCPEFRELENIDPTDILPKAHYEFRALVNADGKCDLEYVCKHPGVARRQTSECAIDLAPLAGEELQSEAPRCGPFWVNLYVWDRSKDYLNTSGVSRPELDALCGVSLFRDGLRVLPYGEPGDDWLLLDQERIQAPAERIGNNQVIGLVQFDQSANLHLRDKTNREGLIENDAFLDLRALVRAAVRQFTKYWRNDRPPARERSSTASTDGIKGARVVATALRETARDDVSVAVPDTALPRDATGGDGGAHDEPGTKVLTQRRAVDVLIEHISGTEAGIRERDERLDTLLQLAATGLAAERVVHEFGRHAVEAVEAAGELRGATGGQAESALRRIEAALETLRSELRVLAPYHVVGRSPRPRLVSMKETAELAIELNRGLLKRWDIEGLVEGPDWSAKVAPTPLLQILDNLVHNACSWLGTVQAPLHRRLGLRMIPSASALVVADTGPGIDDEVARHLFEPFVSMKPGGKGLGLYISSQLASRLGARLRLAASEDAALKPDWATGAVFVLTLGKPPVGAADGTENDDART